MIKSILVPLTGSATDAVVLHAGLAIARRSNAHLDCLYVRPDARLIVASLTSSVDPAVGVATFPSDLYDTLVALENERADAAKRAFDTACKALIVPSRETPTHLSAAYREVEGRRPHAVIANARYNDLTVVAPPEELIWGELGDIILGSGRPIVVVPSKPTASIAEVVTIAWKETAEAARAVTAAMPLLSLAKQIIVLSASEGATAQKEAAHAGERLAQLLGRHGLPVRSELVETKTDDPAKAVMDRALALNSDLLVMGAYGHGRAREFVFGGFTRYALAHPVLPVLMQH